VIKNKQLILTAAAPVLFVLSLSSLVTKPADAQITDVTTTSAIELIYVKVRRLAQQHRKSRPFR
jgi:hypothetical protein